MVNKTLVDFATDEMLFILLAKERAKYRKRNSTAKSHRLDKDCDINELTNRKKLSRMMPPRSKWVRPKKRKDLGKGALALRKLTEKALLLTYKRDNDLFLIQLKHQITHPAQFFEREPRLHLEIIHHRTPYTSVALENLHLERDHSLFVLLLHFTNPAHQRIHLLILPRRINALSGKALAFWYNSSRLSMNVTISICFKCF